MILNRFVNYCSKWIWETVEKKCEIFSKLTITADFISIYFTPFSGVSLVDFEKVGVCWATAAA